VSDPNSTMAGGPRSQKPKARLPMFRQSTFKSFSVIFDDHRHVVIEISASGERSRPRAGNRASPFTPSNRPLRLRSVSVRRLNRLAVDHVVYAPLGVYLEHFAWRKNVSGIVQAPLPLFGGSAKVRDVRSPALQIRRGDCQADSKEPVCTARVRCWPRAEVQSASPRFPAFGGKAD
jgi:hypothetical protein